MVEKEAARGGFGSLTRLIDEWNSGANRFNALCKCLFAAYSNRQPLGIGGISVDPYAEKNTARLRRVYVRASSRRLHVGQKLVKAPVAHADLRFLNVCFFTDTADGDAFYLKWSNYQPSSLKILSAQ